MTAPSYGTRKGVFGSGVPRGALVRPARLVKSADDVANVLELEGHGLDDGDSLEFTVSGAGALPAPLALLTVYYAKLITIGDGTTDENRFQVSATSGGIAIDLTTTGTQPFSMAIPTGPMIDTFLEEFSRWADGKLVNHLVPLEAPYPSWVVRIVELRAAIATATAIGRSMPSLAAREQTAVLDFLTQCKVPMRDGRATSPANLAIAGSAGSSVDANRGTIP